MHKKNTFIYTTSSRFLLFILLLIGYTPGIQAFGFFQETAIQNQATYQEYKGIVIDKKSKTPLVSATIALNDTNISTITNSEGEFSLKVPKDSPNKKITVSFLGYKDKEVSLSSLVGDKTKIKLQISVTELSEINIDPKDPASLIKAVMKKRGENYQSDNTIMTAFYRETIKKRRTYVSLSEAVVDVYKKPYVSGKNDIIRLYKARKSADYKKLDTLTLKLQGGPSSTLFIDVMKNPDLLFTEDILTIYEFSFGQSAKINDRYLYVLNFKQRPNIDDLYYYGKLYIDSETLALTKAVFSLNLEDRDRASKLFVRQKPSRAKVYPTVASYTMNYREKNGRWYYGYGKIDLVFKVNWKKKLFNSTYKLNIEMAITDWKKNPNDKDIRSKDRLKSSVVISDEASGFSDPEFWGEYNVIEPEKSIESAIRKIKKQLRELN